MVSIQEKIASHFIVEPSMVDSFGIEEFAQALRGDIPYDNTKLSIEIWEDFILTWLNGGVFEDKREYMKHLYHTFRNEYAYEGTLYRGMIRDTEGELYPMELASYSSRDEVAFYFAGNSEEFGMMDEECEDESITITVYAEDAFAFDKFLLKLKSLTKNQELASEIEDRIWEEEKIYPLPAYVLDGI